MKKYLLIATWLLFAQLSFAQNQEALDKIAAAKIALITERLALTPEQAERFWPIYREYGDARKGIRTEYEAARKNFNPNEATDEENQKMLEMAGKTKERQLALEKTYSQRILQVISSRQLNNLRKAESDFRDMLLKRVRARQQRTRNDARIKNRRN